MNRRGLYEQLLTELLAERLAHLDPALTARREGLHPAEAADRIALHVSRIVQRALEALPDHTRVDTAIILARTLLETIDALEA